MKLELLGDPLSILLKEQHLSGYACLSGLILEILEEIRLQKCKNTLRYKLLLKLIEIQEEM